MSFNSANISSPEVIRMFRAQFIEFDSSCVNEIEGVRGDVQRTLNWLEGEQKTYWRTQLTKREEAVLVAKSQYTFAKHGGPTGRQSAEEQRIAWKRAQRAKEEAEDKLKKIKRWSNTINQQVIKELKPIEVLASNLSAITPKAIMRLDEMLDNLDIYLRQTSVGPGKPSGSGKEKGGS